MDLRLRGDDDDCEDDDCEDDDCEDDDCGDDEDCEDDEDCGDDEELGNGTTSLGQNRDFFTMLANVGYQGI